MSEILNIIHETLSKNLNELTFEGETEVYVEIENQLLSYFNEQHIDRHHYNKLLNETNSAYDSDEDLLDTESDLLLVFINSFFEDKSNFWALKKLNHYCSSIILEEGIIATSSEENLSSNSKTNWQEIIIWDEIDLIELYKDENDNYYFRFFYRNETSHIDLYSHLFCTFNLESCNILSNMFNQIVEYKKQNIDNSTNEHEELKSNIVKIFNDGNYKEAIEELDNFSNIYNVEDVTLNNSFFYYINKTLAFFHLEQFERALGIIESYINKCERADLIEAYSYELKGEILLKKNEHLSAINCLAYSEENYDDEDSKKDVRLLKEESYSKIKEVFLDIPYNNRKLIFIGEDIYATKSKEILVIKKNDLPPNINFPIGHPHVNEMYTCHQHKQHFYLPLKNYSEELFSDRISEFSWLLQCLGATKLEISSSKSDLSDQKIKSKKEVDANIDYKISSLKVNYKGENTDNTLIDGQLKIAKKQLFNPSEPPYIPADLVWYHSDLNWQRLAHQRLNGSILTHNEVISSSQTENISSHELKQVDAELKLLLPKMGIKYNSEDEINLSSIKKYEWIVAVEFEDKNNLIKLNQNIEDVSPKSILNTSNDNEYNQNLAKYKEDVLFMLENDGIIDELERNLLNRKIKKYGITEKDAKSIESELTKSNYSENELRYIEELTEMLEEGEIGSIEREMLERYAKKFKVSKEVQNKIDAIFIN